jgi:hypothetical protein
MPKGKPPKIRKLVKTTKKMIQVMNRKGKSGLPSITVHGRRKKLRQLGSKIGGKPISRGRGK